MSIGGTFKKNNKDWLKKEKPKHKVLADDFLITQFNIITIQVQDFADILEKKYVFDKGAFIMFYFYMYTYILLFSLKKDYPIEFIDWLEEELTEGYIKTIKTEKTKNMIRKNYNYLKSRYDTIVQDNTPNPLLFTKDLIDLLFNGEPDAILSETIFEIISHHFLFILKTTNQYQIIL